VTGCAFLYFFPLVKFLGRVYFFSWDRPGRRAKGSLQRAATARTADRKTGQNVRRHDLYRSNASMIKQKKKPPAAAPQQRHHPLWEKETNLSQYLPPTTTNRRAATTVGTSTGDWFTAKTTKSGTPSSHVATIAASVFVANDRIGRTETGA